MVGIGTDRATVVAVVDFERALSIADISDAGSGGENNSGDRPAVFDKGDVDSELAVPLEELLGSVERIDAEEAIPERWNMACSDTFFREERDAQLI
jgi:hypothetical protein